MYDDELNAYIKSLELKVNELNAENELLHAQLSDTHRQIAVLEEQLRHYYL